jgi:DNA-binding transcriptional regulator YiaG
MRQLHKSRPSAPEAHPELTAEQAAYKQAIRTLRLQLGLNQTQFARQFGMHGPAGRFTVGTWERVSVLNLPSREHRRRLRRLFETNKIARTRPEFLAGRSPEEVNFAL